MVQQGVASNATVLDTIIAYGPNWRAKESWIGLDSLVCYTFFSFTPTQVFISYQQTNGQPYPYTGPPPQQIYVVGREIWINGNSSSWLKINYISPTKFTVESGEEFLKVP